MDAKPPSRLQNLRELVNLLGLSVQISGETAAILEEIHIRLYSLEEDRKRLLSDYKALDKRCQSLEQRYSELLYRFSEIKRSQD